MGSLRTVGGPRSRETVKDHKEGERVVELTVARLKRYIEHGWNTMLTGPHGVGKTRITERAIQELGWKAWYLNTATCDPNLHFVGVPVPQDQEAPVYDEDGSPVVDKDGAPVMRVVKALTMVRPRDLDECDVVFLDEVNRPQDPMVLAAVMELVLDHSINGEPLPRLKCVVAACNPDNGEYQVVPLDPALLDRFPMQLDVTPRCDLKYFQERYGLYTGRKAVSLWEEYQGKRQSQEEENRTEYISPRAWDKMTEIYFDGGENADDIRATLIGRNPVISVAVLARDLSAARRMDEERSKGNGLSVDASIAAAPTTLNGATVVLTDLPSLTRDRALGPRAIDLMRKTRLAYPTAEVHVYEPDGKYPEGSLLLTGGAEAPKGMPDSMIPLSYKAFHRLYFTAR